MAKRPEKTPVAPAPERSGAKILYGAGALLVVAGAALYFGGYLPEGVTGLLFAGAIIVVAAGYSLNALLGSSSSPALTATVIAVNIAVLAAATAPVALTVTPGEPLAKGEVQAAGDTIPLPADVNGRVRLLLHSDLGTDSGAKTVEFMFDGTTPPLRGELVRTTSTTRAGRRGYATVVHETNTEYITGSLAPDSHKLTLREIDGKIAGALDVRVFKDYLPTGVALLIDLVLLVAVALLASFLNTTSGPAVGAGMAMGLGLLMSRFATPELAVRPTIGAFALGGVAGATLGATVFSIVRRLWKSAPRDTETASA